MASATISGLFSTRETVALETLASRETSSRVAPPWAGSEPLSLILSEPSDYSAPPGSTVEKGRAAVHRAAQAGSKRMGTESAPISGIRVGLTGPSTWKWRVRARSSSSATRNSSRPSAAPGQ